MTGTDLRIHSVFQPVVDLIIGEPIGYEVLSRGEGHEDSADAFLRSARATHGAWEVERACRLAAIGAIARLTKIPGLFFLNVSPDVIEDPRFIEGFTLAQLRLHGIDPSRIVIEITEKTSIVDHDRFQAVIEHYSRQGFQFAVDDFGSGHSGLIALISTTPQYIKLDMEVVRNVHRHAYRRHLVRSLNAFAASVDSRLVAEGVETWEELEALLRLGVRYAQGFLLARPAGEPPVPAEELRVKLRRLARAVNVGLGDADETIDSLLEPAVVYPLGSITVEQIESVFRDSPRTDHVVLLEGALPRGLVTREDLAAKLAGRYGYALRQFKPAERVAKAQPLSVGLGTPVTTLATRAMDRAAGDLYDPVLVVDATGALVGTVRMKALIKRSVELQVRSAQGASPLTGLPGNRAILRWIHEGTEIPTWAVLYADLDRFKEYNDRYGFIMGDELIRLAARILSRTLVVDCPAARLGHIGGDDFVAVFPEGLNEAALQSACAKFDEEKAALFDADDLRRGYIVATNRRGDVEQVPLVTLSLALIDRHRIGEDLHPAILSQLAASLKKKVKQRTAELRRSAYIVERRSSQSSSSGPPQPAPG